MRPPTTSRRSKLSLIVLSVVAGVLLGCGGGDSTSPGTAASSIVIVGAASHTLAGHAIDTVRVEIHDAQGNIFAGKPAVVSLALQSASGGAATLTGPTTATSSGGVARFTGISIANVGQYVLTFSTPGLPAVTHSISVDPLPVVIDSTALRLISDSVARSQGVYTFTGSGTESIDSGRVIVGAQAGGFLRRVTRVTRSGNTVTAETIGAALNEIIQNDSLVAIFASASGDALHAGRLAFERPRFVPASPAVTRTGPDTYAISNLTLASASGSAGLVISSASMSIVVPKPDFVVTFGNLLDPVRTVHLALQPTVTFQLQAALGFSSSFSKSGSVPLGSLEIPGVIGPGIPVLYEIPITLEWSVDAQGSLDIAFGWFSSATRTIGADWTRSGGWVPLQSGTFTFSPQFPTPEVDASGSVHLGIQAAPGIVVADIAGGNLYVQAFAEGNANVDLVANSWSTSCRSAIDVGFDLDLRIIDVTLASFKTGTELASTTWPICAYSGSLAVTVAVEPSALSMSVGDKAVVLATVTNSSDKSVTWTSTNPAVASVDANGSVTAVAIGTTQVVARHSSGATGSSTVTVSSAPSLGFLLIGAINGSDGQAANLNALRGTISVTLNANPGSHTLKELDLTIDGQVVSQRLGSGSGLFTLSFDTTKLPNGSHTLRGVMLLDNGSSIGSTGVLVNISN